MAHQSEIFKKRRTYPVKLPAINENGCYEIRLESIGGLGANLCGKLLGFFLFLGCLFVQKLLIFFVASGG